MMTVNYNKLNKKVDYFLEKNEFYQPHTVVITIIYYCS